MTVPIHFFRDLRLSTLSLILLVAFAGIAGCGSDDSPDVMVSPPGWVAVPSGGQHATSATLTYISNGGTSSCAECHGADLSGGTSKVSCFGNPAGCHHGPVADWVAAPPAAQSHGVAAKKAPGSSGFASCQVCHGADFRTPRGDANRTCYSCHSLAPHPNGPWRSSAGSTHTNTDPSNAPVCAGCHRNANPGTPGCFNNTLCHAQPGAVAHPIPYNEASHYAVTSTTFTGSCGGCHDVSAPSTKAGPVCQTCHVAASPLTAANCTSCHASPPNGGTGAAYANIAGAHSVHLGLNSTGSPVSCNTCHNALGPSLLDNNHYNRAKSRVAPGDVAFLATYNAESGTSSFNSAAFSCSNVSCHGGVARSGGNPGTPLNWRTGTLTVNTACTSCHNSGTAQFNSYNSGEHQLHVVGEGLSCTDCHNTTTLAVNHFTNLGTTAMEGPASATIGGGTTSIPAGNYNGISCDPRCHGRRNW
jgi:predicted CxxxxCH...CXXCH cytochrome family protein